MNKNIIRNKRLPLIFIILIVILTTAYLFLKPSFNYLSGYLSKTEAVEANVLVVEGWLPYYAIEMAFNEFQKNGYEYIITTGMKSTEEYYKVSSNGYLIFYPKNRFSTSGAPGKHLIEVDAFSELGNENRAHFNLFINDSIKADFYSEVHKKKYSINWFGPLNMIDSIMVEFDNDSFGEFGDRNLYVKDITIDHKIVIPYLNNSVYDISEPDGKNRIINNFVSNAELARYRLIILGVDSTLITAVPGERSRINRTLTSALAMHDWLDKSGLEVKGINIISSGTHARRTWMTYNKILKKKYAIGIISLPDNINGTSRKSRILKTFRETIGIIYYWLILIPY